ncbi:hypothetical protein ACUN9V_03555 [Salinicola sp. V024]|uniref:hypothetical protein n=1 Tax=Salinicola sp. V024 TaxID=3459609 RepID=UPI0040444A39
MSTRYFVRAVNPNSLEEHFVVADFHQNGACVNVYFNRPAAQEETRWLNRRHHRQQLKDAHYFCLDGSGSLTIFPPQIEATAAHDAQVGDISPQSAPSAPHSVEFCDAGDRPSNASASWETREDILHNLSRRRLVR